MGLCVNRREQYSVLVLPPHPLYLQPSLSMALAGGSAKDPDDVTSVTRHLRGHRPCHLRTNEEHGVQQRFPDSGGGKGAAEAKQEQGLLVMETPRFPQNPGKYRYELGVWGLGCPFLHSTGISLWWLLSPAENAPWPKEFTISILNLSVRRRGKKDRSNEALKAWKE